MAKKQLPPGWGNATGAGQPDWEKSVIAESTPAPSPVPTEPTPETAPTESVAAAPTVPATETPKTTAMPSDESVNSAPPSAELPESKPEAEPAPETPADSFPDSLNEQPPAMDFTPEYLSEEETYPTSAEIPKKQSNSKLMIILTVSLLVLLAALIVLGYLFYFGNRQSTEDSVAEVAITETTVSTEMSTTVLETTTSIMTETMTETTTVSSEAPTEAPTEAPVEAARSTAQAYNFSYAVYGQINCHGGRVDSFSSVYVLDGGAREIVRTSLGDGWHITAVRYCYNYSNVYYECYDSDDGDYYGWVDGNYIDFYSDAYVYGGSNWNDYSYDDAEDETQATAEATTTTVAPEPSVKTKTETIGNLEFEYVTYYSDGYIELTVNSFDIVPTYTGTSIQEFDIKIDATLSGANNWDLKYTAYDADGYELSSGTLAVIEAATKKTESLLVPSDAARVVIEFSYD